MKKAFGIKLFAFALLAVVATACSKYEEGSKFTLLTKKMRIVNTWKLDKITYTSGGMSTTSTGDVTLDIKKDNTYESTGTWGGFSFTETGTWDFNSDKTKVIFTDSNGDAVTNTIIKLKNKEMSFEDVDGNVTTRTDYVQK